MTQELRLKNGIQCIDVNAEERCISILVPEGWRVVAMTTDSGQALDIETTSLPEKEYPTLVVVRPRRVDIAPVFAEFRKEFGK